MGLPEGHTRIGGDDPDIAIKLEQDAETVIVVSSQGITLSPPVPVWVDGLRWDSGACVPLQRVIDLAGQLLVVCRYDDTPQDLVIIKRKENTSLRRHTLRKVMMAGVLMMTITGGLSLATFYSLTSPGYQPVKQDDGVSAHLSSSELTGLQTFYDKEGLFHLSGVVASEKALRALISVLRDKDIKFYNQSTSAESIRHRVQQLLYMYGYHDVEVLEGQSSDTVKIFGNIHYNDNWIQASRELTGIRGLAGWEVINDRAELFDRLLARFESHDLLGGLNISTTGKEFLIQGQFSDAVSEKIMRVISGFNKSERSRITARFNNIPVTVSLSAVLPADIVSVGGRRDATFLQLTNDMRLYKGTTLASGFRVFAVNPEWLLLVRRQQLISIPVNL